LYASKRHNRPFRGGQEFFDSQIVLSAANLENLEIWEMVKNFLGTLCKTKIISKIFRVYENHLWKRKIPGHGSGQSLKIGKD